jgi:hypothetical protein
MAIGNTRWIESMDKRRKEAKLRGGHGHGLLPVGLPWQLALTAL